MARRGWVLAALVGMLIYLPTLRYDFTYDDQEIVRENGRIRDLKAPARYLATSWWGKPGRGTAYRPAAMASFALNYAVGGVRPAGYHAVNIALHGLICALLWLIGARLLVSPRVGLAASLLFAVHPVHVEAVAGVVGRAELMATLGFLLTVLAAAASARARSPLRRALWTPAVFAGAALAVFAKEHGVMLLPFIFALCLIPLRSAEERPFRLSAGAAARRLPALLPALGAVALAVGLCFLARRVVLGAFLTPHLAKFNELDNPLILLSGGPRLMTAISVIGRYGLLLAAPFNPSPDYSLQVIMPVTSAGDPLWLPGLILMIVAVAGVFLLPRRPAPLFGLLFLSITFVIASNLFLTIGTIMAERLLYLPSVGFCFLAAGLAVGAEPAIRGRRWWVIAIFGLWGASLLVQHFRYLPVWRNDEALYTYMVRRVPQSARAHNTYAAMLAHQGKSAEAREHLEQAVAIYPNYIEAYANLAVSYADAGEDDKALPILERTHAADPSIEVVSLQLALILTRRGEAGRAESILRWGLRDAHDSPLSHAALGVWLVNQKRWKEALPFLYSLPYLPSYHWYPAARALARTYVELGMDEQALPLLETLIKPGPQSDPERILKARVLIKRQRGDEAARLLDEVLGRRPADPEARALREKIRK